MRNIRKISKQEKIILQNEFKLRESDLRKSLNNGIKTFSKLQFNIQYDIINNGYLCHGS